jgi:hypothetical protein
VLEGMHEITLGELLMKKEWIKDQYSTIWKMQREMDEMKKQTPENEDGEAQSAESEVENLKV